MVNCDSFEQAMQEAEAGALAYASDSSVDYLGFAQSYYMAEDRIATKTEVFSLLRESKLEPEAYISRFFDTGHERQQETR